MLFSVVLAQTPFIFESIQYIDGEPIPQPAPGIIVFLIHFPLLFIISFVYLFYRIKQASGIIRAQLISFSVMAITTVISVVFLGPVFSLFVMISITYAILRYRFLSIRLLVSKKDGNIGQYRHEQEMKYKAINIVHEIEKKTKVLVSGLYIPNSQYDIYTTYYTAKCVSPYAYIKDYLMKKLF